MLVVLERDLMVPSAESALPPSLKAVGPCKATHHLQTLLAIDLADLASFCSSFRDNCVCWATYEI